MGRFDFTHIVGKFAEQADFNPGFESSKTIELSGIKITNSIVFEDSNPGLKSACSANIPTICVKSNLPIIYDKDIPLKCIVDTIGDVKHSTNIIKGPRLYRDYIDYEYLNDFINNYQ